MLAFRFEQVFLKLRQLACSVKAIGINQIWYVGLQVAMFLCVQIQHELGQSPVQPCHRATHDGKARMGQAGRGLEVQAFQTLTQGNVVPGLEIKAPGRAPGANLNVIVFTLAGWYIFIREIRDTGQEGVELLLESAELVFGFRLLFLQVFHLVQQRLDVLAGSLGLADRLRPLVLLALQVFRAHLKGTAAFLKLLEGGGIEFEILDGQPTGDLFCLGADTFGIEHDYPESSG